MRKVFALILVFVFTISFSACSSGEKTSSEVKTAYSKNDYSSSKSSSKSYDYSSSKSSSKSYDYSSSYSSSNNSVTHYCEASGCTREGTKKYEGFGGTEYYCETHYNEMMKMIGKMESDVGAGAYSKHTCEVCSKEGTYEIIGISGQKEYYCSEHYYEMKDLIDSLK